MRSTPRIPTTDRPPVAPDDVDRLYADALAARRALDPERAVVLLLEALAISPGSTACLLQLGKSYVDLGRHDDAIAIFDQAIGIEPNFAKAYVGRGLALKGARRPKEGLADGLRAARLEPESPEIWTGLGWLFDGAALFDMAAKAFRTAAALAPHRPDLKGLELQELTAICDWSRLDVLIAEIDARVADGEYAISPFYWQAISHSSASLQRVARLASRASTPDPTVPVPARPRAAGSRIRIGYVSGELNESANGLCMAGVFEAHDKEAIDVIAFDNGIDDGSAIRRRIVAAFSEMVPVRAMSDRQLADAVRERGVDVLVNLNGFFGNDRSAMFRLKPAPIQVNYLGCPGTMGAPYMDYIVADATVVPEWEKPFYDEKIVWLRDSYYPTDRARPISDRIYSRAECGLPIDGFVFCCFNNSHKILPDTFTIWMHILNAVPGSVLWLFAANPQATNNLRAAAASRGVDPQRLVFAAHAAPAEHLARHRLADLFLDTLPYNAHTTTIDALWAGLPVLTCIGQTFPGRVAASVLGAIGMPELVTRDALDYRRRAIDLASDAGALGRLRAKLQAHRMITPLFDTARFTGNLECAYRTMVERQRSGLVPADFAVDRETR